MIFNAHILIQQIDKANTHFHTLEKKKIDKNVKHKRNFILCQINCIFLLSEMHIKTINRIINAIRHPK